jgi:hypothetical protein
MASLPKFYLYRSIARRIAADINNTQITEPPRHVDNPFDRVKFGDAMQPHPEERPLGRVSKDEVFVLPSFETRARARSSG